MLFIRGKLTFTILMLVSSIMLPYSKSGRGGRMYFFLFFKNFVIIIIIIILICLVFIPFGICMW